MIKNTSMYRANTFGFYAYNGKSVVNTYGNSKQESVIDFLDRIRLMNPFNRILVILDNFSAHKTEDVMIKAEVLGIELIFLPPYSPKLNPIEYIWKSIKRVVSRKFVKEQDSLIELFKSNFNELSKITSFCRSWIEKFVNSKDI